MADITRRRTGELLRKLFEILRKQPEGMRAKDALAALVEQVKLTDYESGTYANGSRRFEKIVRFATVDCVKAAWLVKTKGLWIVTEAGISALEKIADPEAFYKEAVRLYQEWRAAHPNTDDDTPEETPVGSEGGERSAAEAFEEAEEESWQQIEGYLSKMPPYDFQNLVGDLLRAMGYYVAWIAPPGKDGGVDIMAFTDPLGTRPPRIKVQVKRQKDSVRVDGLRAFMAVLGPDDVGIFVCTGGFTKDAQDEARNQPSRRITLINMDLLFELWVEHYAKLGDSARQRMPLRPVWFLAPLD